MWGSFGGVHVAVAVVGPHENIALLEELLVQLRELILLLLQQQRSLVFLELLKVLPSRELWV
jgi:hypothetical protein